MSLQPARQLIFVVSPARFIRTVARKCRCWSNRMPVRPLAPPEIAELIERVREQFYTVGTRKLILDLLGSLDQSTHEDAHIYRHLWESRLRLLRGHFGPLFDE